MIETRFPLKKNLLHSKPLLNFTAINTVPTGFSFDPPVGPAIPVMETARSVFARRAQFFAIKVATSLETAPYFFINFGGILSNLIFSLL